MSLIAPAQPLAHQDSPFPGQAASPPAWTLSDRVQGYRSGESAITAEALVNNAR